MTTVSPRDARSSDCVGSTAELSSELEPQREFGFPTPISATINPPHVASSRRSRRRSSVGRATLS